MSRHQRPTRISPVLCLSANTFWKKKCSCCYHIMCTVCNLWLNKTRKNSDGTAEYNSMFVCYVLCREVAIMSQHQVHPPSIPLREFAAWLFISKKRLINYQCYWSSIAFNKNLKGIGFKGTVHEKNHPLATHHDVRSLWWHFLNHMTTLSVTKGQTSTQYKCNMAMVSNTNK